MQYIEAEGKHFFAAANTHNGFKSLFSGIFNEKNCDKIYILKGGPGVGKSTFMKKAAMECEKQGFETEYFHCSSDPDSLDGILVKEKRIAIVDGTSPHCVEPSLAGAFEEIIDLGKAWDTDGLFDNRQQLKSISADKKKHYENAYSNLEVCKKLTDICKNKYKYSILWDKLNKSAVRLAQSVLCKKHCEAVSETKLAVNAISCKGTVKICSFEDNAQYCIFVKEPFFASRLASEFMEAVRKYANEKGTEMLVSLCPLDTSIVDGLYFPKEKVSISLYDEKLVAKCDKSMKKCKIVNTARFIDTKQISAWKKERKFLQKIYDNLFDKALKELSLAGANHFELEKIYSRFTDYSKVESITNEFIKTVIKNQKPRQ